MIIEGAAFGQFFPCLSIKLQADALKMELDKRI